MRSDKMFLDLAWKIFLHDKKSGLIHIGNFHKQLIFHRRQKIGGLLTKNHLVCGSLFYKQRVREVIFVNSLNFMARYALCRISAIKSPIHRAFLTSASRISCNWHWRASKFKIFWEPYPWSPLMPLTVPLYNETDPHFGRSVGGALSCIK